MACKHERFKCTNNVFICLLCGTTIENPYRMDKHTGQEENAKETAKKANKRKSKKEAD